MTTEARHEAEIIADQNDLFRSQIPAPVCVWKGAILQGRVACTPGIQRLHSDDLDQIVYAVKTFDKFTPDNNPHGERDFGSFTTQTNEGEITVSWKIDYYAPDYEHGSNKPEDAKSTRRVLTIMRDHEY